MNNKKTSEQLTRLGLDGFHTGTPTALQIPTPGIAHGFTGTQTLQAFAATDFMNEDWHALTHSDAHELNVEISVLPRDTHFLLLNFATPVTLHSAAPQSDGVKVFPELNSVLVHRQKLDQPIALLDESMRGLLLSIENAEPFISQLVAPTDNDFRLPEITSDIKLWAEELADAWLFSEINKFLATNHAWNHALAVGMLVRLRRHSPDERQNLLERLRAGNFRPKTQPALDWIRSLEPEQYDYLENTTLVNIEDNLRDIDSALKAREQDASDWYHDALRILQHRDNIESVTNLLGFAERHTPLRNALLHTDERGRELAGCLDPLLVDASDIYEDEQLERASLINPTDWWTQPGREF